MKFLTALSLALALSLVSAPALAKDSEIEAEPVCDSARQFNAFTQTCECRSTIRCSPGLVASADCTTCFLQECPRAYAVVPMLLNPYEWACSYLGPAMPDCSTTRCPSGTTCVYSSVYGARCQ